MAVNCGLTGIVPRDDASLQDDCVSSGRDSVVGRREVVEEPRRRSGTGIATSEGEGVPSTRLNGRRRFASELGAVDEDCRRIN